MGEGEGVHLHLHSLKLPHLTGLGEWCAPPDQPAGPAAARAFYRCTRDIREGLPRGLGEVRDQFYRAASAMSLAIADGARAFQPKVRSLHFTRALAVAGECAAVRATSCKGAGGSRSGCGADGATRGRSGRGGGARTLEAPIGRFRIDPRRWADLGRVATGDFGRKLHPTARSWRWPPSGSTRSRSPTSFALASRA